MAKQIEVMVSPDGEIKITTSGYKGSECQKATESLERALGTKISDAPTAEAKSQEANHNARANR